MGDFTDFWFYLFIVNLDGNLIEAHRKYHLTLADLVVSVLWKQLPLQIKLVEFNNQEGGENEEDTEHTHSQPKPNGKKKGNCILLVQFPFHSNYFGLHILGYISP